MFWGYVNGSIFSTSGLIGSERDGITQEFQGDKYGCEKFGKRPCGRPCGRGHTAREGK